MSIKRKIVTKLNGLVRRTYWYNNIAFPDCKKFWSLKQFNLDVVNLGSSSGNHAFNYEGVGLKCSNWALSPKSLLLDYEVLRNYFSFLRNGATVIIPLCPFSCLVGYDCYVRDYMYTILRHNTIPHFRINKRVEMMEKKSKPLSHYPLVELIRDFKLLINRIFQREDKRLIGDQWEKDADKWMNGWKYQFSILQLDDDWNMVNRDSYEEASEILKNILDFCLNRGLKPVVVVPPVTDHLYQRFSKKLIERNIKDFVKQSNPYNVPFYNYLDDKQFRDDSLFLNSFFLNRKGAQLFTKRVLSDIGL